MQVVDVGTAASARVEKGQYALSYGGEVTACIAFDALHRSMGVEARLLALDGVTEVGVRRVSSERLSRRISV